MNKIQTPFTKEQVKNLNSYQESGSFHPFTCINDGDELHIKYEFDKEHSGNDYEDFLKKERSKGINYPEMAFTETKLIATENGWICPVCNYKQNWAHTFMSNDNK